MIQFHQNGHNNNHFKVVWPTGYVVLSFKASLPGTQGPMSHFVPLPEIPRHSLSHAHSAGTPGLPHSMSPLVPLYPQVSVNGKRLDLTYSFLGSQGVGQCYDSSPCERQPCRNGATCMPAGEYEFQCLCQDGFKGARASPGHSRVWDQQPKGQKVTPAHPPPSTLSNRRPL